jgi:hypothetical protein
VPTATKEETRVTTKFEPFLVMVLMHPLKAKNSDGEMVEPEIVVKPEWVLAQDPQQAGIKASWMVPEEYRKNIARLEVRVRPF